MLVTRGLLRLARNRADASDGIYIPVITRDLYFVSAVCCGLSNGLSVGIDRAIRKDRSTIRGSCREQVGIEYGEINLE